MKKLKIRGNELKKIGFTNDRAIALALNIVNKHCKRSDKMEVMELLEKINLLPETACFAKRGADARCAFRLWFAHWRRACYIHCRNSLWCGNGYRLPHVFVGFPYVTEKKLLNS